MQEQIPPSEKKMTKECIWFERPSLFPNRPATIYFRTSKKEDVQDASKQTLATKLRKERGLYFCFFNAVEFLVVKHAFKTAGFKQTSSNEQQQWNCLWGKRLKAEDYGKLNEYQKVNHFPSSFELGRKDTLHRNLSRMRRLFPKEYDFFPEGFLIPEDADYFVSEFKKLEQATGTAPVFIRKPKASSCGKGIKVVNKLSQINMKKEWLIQRYDNGLCNNFLLRYIANPLLIDGKKFDLRIYVAVTSFDPLRVYLHEDGLVRFATEAYSSKKKLGNRFVHLTNYSVNRKAQNFVHNDNAEEDGVGSKWSIQALRRYFKQNNINDAPLWPRVKDLIIKTLISVESAISTATKRLVPNGYAILHIIINE